MIVYDYVFINKSTGSYYNYILYYMNIVIVNSIYYITLYYITLHYIACNNSMVLAMSMSWIP